MPRWALLWAASAALAKCSAQDFEGVGTQSNYAQQESILPGATADVSLPAESVDYFAKEELEVAIDVDGVKHMLRCDAGQSVTVCSRAFVQSLQLQDDVVPRLVEGLLTVSEQQKPEQAKAGGDSAKRVIAEVPVVLNDEERVAVLFAGEEPATAARRWAQEAGLAADEELDSILRTLTNRLRYAVGARDGLPFTVDSTSTVATVDVNAGDGTGRILKLRVLEGESAGDAAAGFLERAGFDVSANYEPLRRMAQAKLDEVAQVTAEVGETAVPESPPLPLLDPEEGFVLPVTFDGRPSDEALPLLFRYGQDPAIVAKDFLLAAGLSKHDRLDEFVADIEAALRAQVASRRLDGTQGAELTSQSRAEDAAEVSAEAIEAAMQPLLASAPYSAIVPLQVGQAGYDVEVPAGAPLRAVARVFCAKQWVAIRKELQSALNSLAGNPREAATATPDMCSAVASDLMGRWFLAKAAGMSTSATNAGP